MAINSFELLEVEYRLLWDSMTIRPAKATDIDTTAKRILAKKARYQEVQAAVGVPWFVVGAIHAMECGLNFDRHLHCGDPLTKRTVHVPKGRPKTPPKNGKCYSWLESAIDALEMKNLGSITDWSVERICYELERYNGWGYRNYHPKTLSPYLWSGTNHYTQGKYVADGKWSALAVSGQSGAMAIIKRISELDVSVAAALASNEPEPDEPHETINEPESETDPALEFPKTEDVPVAAPAPPRAAPVAIAKAAFDSRTVWGLLLSLVLWIAQQFKSAVDYGFEVVMWAVGVLPDVTNEVQGVLSSGELMASWFKLNWPSIAFYVAIGCTVIAIIRHANDKKKLRDAKDELEAQSEDPAHA
jgi:lysozyme family protein